MSVLAYRIGLILGCECSVLSQWNKAAFFDFTAVEGWGANKIYTKGWAQGEVGRQMLSFIFVEIIAAIFDFYSSGRLGRQQNLYQGGECQSKEGGQGEPFPAPIPHHWL